MNRCFLIQGMRRTQLRVSPRPKRRVSAGYVVKVRVFGTHAKNIKISRVVMKIDVVFAPDILDSALSA